MHRCDRFSLPLDAEPKQAHSISPIVAFIPRNDGYWRISSTAEVRRSDMREVLSSIIVPVPIEVAWEVYLDFESWGLRSNFYERIEWLNGKPWQQHSRARLHQLWPTAQMVLLRVLQAQRPYLLSALYHANGLTSTKSVRFHARALDSTEVQIQTECLGESLDPAIVEADVVLRELYEQSLKDFADECLTRAGRTPKNDSQASGSREKSA